MAAREIIWEDVSIDVKLFGGLSVTVGDTVIVESSLSRSRQLWNLLEYLIAFRNKAISPRELYEALWEDEPVDNPASALKNLVYRARTALSGLGVPFAKEMIRYSGGTYQWNNDITCAVDAERFEELVKRAGNPAQPLRLRIEYYHAAIELYTGDFLASSGKRWVAPLAGYYRSVYLNSVRQALELLESRERYPEMIGICQKALESAPYDEELHAELIRAYTRQGLQKEALEHYRRAFELFALKLGRQPSPVLRSLYRQLAKTSSGIGIDIGIIRQDLRESETSEGAFFCEYEVFKNIYQVLARTAPRTGQSIFLALFTLTEERPEPPDSGMDCLFQAIHDATRRCDVFARFSAVQYIVLFTADAIQNCETAARRIADAYIQSCGAPPPIHTIWSLDEL